MLILDERYRHILTWRPGVGLYLSKAELRVELEKKTVVQLRQQCKDQGLSVSGSEHELVQRLLAATEAEDDLETWVESRLTEAEDDLEAPAPTEAPEKMTVEPAPKAKPAPVQQPAMPRPEELAPDEYSVILQRNK